MRRFRYYHFKMSSAKCILLLPMVLLSAVTAAVGPHTTTESAATRMYRDFIGGLYKEVGEAQVSNIYNMVKIFSVSTVEQAQQVVHYVDEHCNLTRSESQTLRMAGNASVEIGECIFKREMELLQTYRHTGYNVQSCIRAAQITYEKSYTDHNAKLDRLKAKIIATYRSHTHELKNCLDSECNMRVLLQSIVQLETLREELRTEIAESNNLTSRYIVTSIAMGCVSSALQQIHHNYNVGKEQMARCFHLQQQQQQQQHQQHNTRGMHPYSQH